VDLIDRLGRRLFACAARVSGGEDEITGLSGESNVAKQVSSILHGSGVLSPRDSLLRQIERKKGGAKRVQRATEDIVEAEFREVCLLAI
jgi:hypothetical protein